MAINRGGKALFVIPSFSAQCAIGNLASGHAPTGRYLIPPRTLEVCRVGGKLRVSAARITAAIGVSVASGILVMVSTAAAAALLAILAYVDGTAVQLRILELAYRASDLVRFLIQHDAASLGSPVGRFEDVGLI